MLHPRLGELFAATAGIPRQDALLFDEQLTPGPARDLSDTRGVGNPASNLPEHLVVGRSTLRRILYTRSTTRCRVTSLMPRATRTA
ncbi:hypothetical protein BFF78_37720 [Streptomyces fodineus]|uniref:Uncharacterized protein n=1 Tax=Streptomyces fodineus TaxID=1904616 RepID=A0A1D7YKA7_9ACTN|nr:hypothetical protein [Streptomyces fodineus]AOR36033.1 hypothetical protein BFF78_37720 [Streptomyces fodineus]